MGSNVESGAARRCQALQQRHCGRVFGVDMKLAIDSRSSGVRPLQRNQLESPEPGERVCIVPRDSTGQVLCTIPRYGREPWLSDKVPYKEGDVRGQRGPFEWH
jgi:hypothetical protein